MVNVVLRNGKVLVYNRGEGIAIEDGAVAVRTEGNDDKGGWLIARIPMEIVERAEFVPPCRIRRAKALPKRRDY